AQGRCAGRTRGGGREFPDPARAARCAGPHRSGARGARSGASRARIAVAGVERLRGRAHPAGRRAAEGAEALKLKLLVLLAFLCATGAQAHKPSDSYLTLNVDGAAVHGRWDIALRDLEFAIGLDADGNSEIT